MDDKANQAKETLCDQHIQLQRQTEHYQVLLDKEKIQLTSLDTKIKEMQARILEKKKQMKRRKPQKQRKEIRIMEERLHQATVCFNKLLCENQELSINIDDLLRQRTALVSRYQELRKELQEQESIMGDLVEKLMLVYDQRSETLTQILATQERSQKDDVLHHNEMMELERITDHNIKLHSFMLQKSQEKESGDEDEEARKRKAMHDHREWMGVANLDEYRSVHQRIVELTGESDLSQICRTFVENEEENFANFNYINVLNNRSTRLQEQTSKLKKKVEQLKLKNLQDQETRKNKLKELEVKVELRSHRADVVETQYTEVWESLAEQKSLVCDVFTQLKCEASVITEHLASSAELTEDNITHFLCVIEERMEELLMALVKSEFIKAEDQQLMPHNPLLVSCSLLPTKPLTSTEPPALLHYDDGATDDILGPGKDKLLDSQALHELVLPRVVKAEQLRCFARIYLAKQKAKKKVGHFPRSA